MFVCETQTVYDSHNDYVLPIAHGEGNYYHPNPSEVNVALRYKFSNPNGSIKNIAGIFNKEKNVLGMMPHPERMIDQSLSGEDGSKFFKNLINNIK